MRGKEIKTIGTKFNSIKTENLFKIDVAIGGLFCIYEIENFVGLM